MKRPYFDIHAIQFEHFGEGCFFLSREEISPEWEVIEYLTVTASIQLSVRVGDREQCVSWVRWEWIRPSARVDDRCSVCVSKKEYIRPSARTIKIFLSLKSSSLVGIRRDPWEIRNCEPFFYFLLLGKSIVLWLIIDGQIKNVKLKFVGLLSVSHKRNILHLERSQKTARFSGNKRTNTNLTNLCGNVRQRAILTKRKQAVGNWSHTFFRPKCTQLLSSWLQQNRIVSGIGHMICFSAHTVQLSNAFYINFISNAYILKFAQSLTSIDDWIVRYWAKKNCHEFYGKIKYSIFLFVWALVSLFNGISTFVNYWMPRPSLLKDSNGTI